jgi:hypothetical protein
MRTSQTATDTATEQPKADARDARGRFTKGNAGGPGNPFARQVALLRASLVHSVTAQEIIRIGDALKQKALSGDVAGIKLFFQYVLGKPEETVDPDRIAVDEWQKLKDAAIAPEEAANVIQHCPATMACYLVKKEWPGEVERNMREALEEHTQAEAEAAEDERYLEARSAEEEEAFLASLEAGSGDPRLTRDARPARNKGPARPARAANRKTAARDNESPSPNGESPSPNGESPSPNGEMRLAKFRAALGRVLSAAYGDGKEEAIDAILNGHRPSPNGEGTAGAAHE